MRAGLLGVCDQAGGAGRSYFFKIYPPGFGAFHNARRIYIE